MPNSRRRYLTEDDLEEYADISVTDSDEAMDQISQAEEDIDAYVGPQEKFFDHELVGKAQSASSTTIQLQSNHISGQNTDYYKDCQVEIIGGTGVGQTKRCTGYNTDGTLTTEAFTTAPDSTSIYRIYQLAKFPRKCDSRYESELTETWYKWIPENVKRAVAAQMQYRIEMGAAYFSTDASLKTGERIGDYSYTKRESGTGIDLLIAPKAKQFLRGIKNRVGTIIND